LLSSEKRNRLSIDQSIVSRLGISKRSMPRFPPGCCDPPQLASAIICIPRPPPHPQFATFATLRIVPGQYPEVAKSSHCLAAKVTEGALMHNTSENRESHPNRLTIQRPQPRVADIFFSIPSAPIYPPNLVRLPASRLTPSLRPPAWFASSRLELSMVAAGVEIYSDEKH